QGERDAAARRRVRVEAWPDQQSAARVPFDGYTARLPSEPRVLLLLQAAHAFAVDVGEADQAGRQRAVRIGALRLLHDADARQLEGSHALGARVLDPALQEDERAALREPRAHRGGVETERGGEARRG